MAHNDDQHKVDFGIQHHDFSSLEEFTSWKEEEEAQTHTFFTLHDKPYAFPPLCSEDCPKMRYYYVCCRDGHYKPSTKERKTNKKRNHQKSSRKLEAVCTSRMYVTEMSSGAVKVKYVSAHSNHKTGPSEDAFVPLPASVKESIAMKLSLGIPTERIIQDIREDIGHRTHRKEFDETVLRKHLVTRLDVLNVKRNVHTRAIVKHDDDATSVLLAVTQLQQEEHNPVLYFKQQHCEDHENPQLTKEAFVLVLQTEFQQQMYQQFAHKILCIDSTHGTNAYRFKLLTLMVADDYASGQPVAWCISDREDQSVVQLFLESVRDRSPLIEVTTIMTDDDNTGWNSAKEVHGPALKHLLCIWHVDRAWRSNIHSKVSSQNQMEMYQTLCILQSELDEEEFLKMKENFIQRWEPTEPSFITYFKQYYASRAEKWAKCHCKFEHADTETNMYLESFHNKLKTTYLNGKVNRRVDVLLDVLLRLEHDQYFQYQLRHRLQHQNKATATDESRHTRGLSIPSDGVKMVDNGIWNIPSQSGNRSQGYVVCKIASECPEANCTLKCAASECKELCFHLYQCDKSCYDFTNGHICKHIHRVHSLQSEATQTNGTAGHGSDPNPLQSDVSSDDTCHVPYCIPEKCARPVSDSQIQLKTTFSLVNKLQNVLSEENPSLYECLPHVNSLLKNALSSCEAAHQIYSQKKEAHAFSNKENVAPGKKMDLQPRFSATSSGPGRKKRKNALHQSDSENRAKLVKLLTTEEDITVDDNDTKDATSDVKSEHSQKGKETVASMTAAKRHKRCGTCTGCTTEDCGMCRHCKDMKRFGGPGRLKKSCKKRVCTGEHGANSSTKVQKPSTTKEQTAMKEPQTVAGRVSLQQYYTGLLTHQYIKLPGANFHDDPIPPAFQGLFIPRVSKQPSVYERVQQFLSAQDRKLETVMGDGNCLFRVISLQVCGSPDAHNYIRDKVVRFIHANKAKFSVLVMQQPSIEAHLVEMKKPGTWGTQVELQAAATLLQRPVYVVTQHPRSEEFYWLRYSPYPPSEVSKLETDILGQNSQLTHLELVHIGHSHFDSITRNHAGVLQPLLAESHHFAVVH